MQMKSLALMSGASMAMAASMMADQRKPRHVRPRWQERETTPEERAAAFEAERLAREEAAARINERKIAAEMKRAKRAAKNVTIAAKGAAIIYTPPVEVLTVPAKHSSIVMGGEPVTETKSERDARKKREKRAAEKSAKLDKAFEVLAEHEAPRKTSYEDRNGPDSGSGSLHGS